VAGASAKRHRSRSSTQSEKRRIAARPPWPRAATAHNSARAASTLDGDVGMDSYATGAGRDELPMRYASTPRAQLRPSAIAQTMSD